MLKTQSQLSPRLLPHNVIEEKIFIVRGQKVMLDHDLASLYGVETKYLNRQVKRNPERFPQEFMFRLSKSEARELVTICHRFKTLKHSSSLPCAFTENGVAMLAGVLNSQRAIRMSIHIIKTFVRLKQWLSTHKELFQKFNDLERRIEKQDGEIQTIMKAIRQLMQPPAEKPKARIGFHP